MPMTDRSKIGVLAAGPATRHCAPRTPALRRACLDRPARTRQLSFSRVVEEDLQALALYPDSSMANVDLHVEATRPDGSRIELIRFRPQPDWARRYWFERSIALPRGSRIDAIATFEAALLPPGAAPAKRADASTLRLTLNVTGR